MFLYIHSSSRVSGEGGERPSVLEDIRNTARLSSQAMVIARFNKALFRHQNSGYPTSLS